MASGSRRSTASDTGLSPSRNSPRERLDPELGEAELREALDAVMRYLSHDAGSPGAAILSGLAMLDEMQGRGLGQWGEPLRQAAQQAIDMPRALSLLLHVCLSPSPREHLDVVGLLEEAMDQSPVRGVQLILPEDPDDEEALRDRPVRRALLQPALYALMRLAVPGSELEIHPHIRDRDAGVHLCLRADRPWPRLAARLAEVPLDLQDDAWHMAVLERAIARHGGQIVTEPGRLYVEWPDTPRL